MASLNIDDTRELLDVLSILELEVLGAFCLELIFVIEIKKLHATTAAAFTQCF